MNGSGPVRLHVGLFAGGTWILGTIPGGTPVLPEPLIGESAYEKFTWWSGSMNATNLNPPDLGSPGGVWGADSAASGSTVAHGQTVHLVGRLERCDRG